MVKKRNPGSEDIETGRESNRPRKQPNLVPAGRPQAENLANPDLNEQLRTEGEELRGQVLELRESKHLDERSIRGWEWLARIAEENPDPVMQVSKNGVIQYRNPASFALCRQWHPSDELIVPPAIHKIVNAAYASAEVMRQEMTVGDRTYLITVAPVPAPAKYVNVYASDITERKQAEEALRESEERLKATLHSMRDEVWIVDAQGRVALINEAVQEHLGVAPDRWKDVDAAVAELEIFLPDGTPRPAEQAPLTRSLHGEVLTSVQEMIRNLATGELRWREVTSAPIRDQAGQITGAVVVVRDITERKQAEEELRKLTATLESKVTQRTAELRHRARQLQKLTLEMSAAEERERKRLAAILHDDVQQIIAAAKFHLTVLRNRVKDDASVQAIGSQIDEMLREAVEKSRGLSHELSPAALYEDFAQALGQLASQIQAKHGLVVQVHATGPIHLQSDAVRAFIYRTAQELLFNAAKHAQVKEARIRVQRLGRCLCLTVSDRGRGFDPQDLRETAGFGLLSIRERIGLLGGRMKIKSAPGQGSKFFLIVPDGETATAGSSPI